MAFYVCILAQKCKHREATMKLFHDLISMSIFNCLDLCLTDIDTNDDIIVGILTLPLDRFESDQHLIQYIAVTYGVSLSFMFIRCDPDHDVSLDSWR